MTVAFGLLAFEIAVDRAGTVLGTALAIKMIAYVGMPRSPVASRAFCPVAASGFIELNAASTHIKSYA